MGWKLYDSLLKGIPDDILVEEAVHQKWWAVKTEANIGLPMYFEQEKAY